MQRRNTRRREKLRKQAETQARYRKNDKAGIKNFSFAADCDLLQKILQVICPERLPPRVGDYTKTEIQSAFRAYMTEEWLGAWADVFQYSAVHAAVISNVSHAKHLPPMLWSAHCTLVANAVVLGARCPRPPGGRCQSYA
jgi:hypothetical protein